MYGKCLSAAWGLLLFSCICLFGQSRTRPVKGRICDEDGRPKADAVILTDTGDKFKPDADGTFFIQVPYQCQYIIVSADAYLEAKCAVDGSYLLVHLQKDKRAIAAAAREAEEREKREELNRLWAEREALAAQEREKQEAEERAREEELARIQAEKEAQAAQVRERRAAEEKARSEEKARKRAIWRTKEETYATRFRTKGIEQTLSLSYAYQLGACEVQYLYSGYREYGNLHPWNLNYTVAYMLNRTFSAGIGVGVQFNAQSITILGDTFHEAYVGTRENRSSLSVLQDSVRDTYAGFQEKRLDIPIYVTLKVRPFCSSLRPVVALAGGYYVLSGTPYGEAALGGEWRLRRTTAVHACMLVRTSPYPVVTSVSASYGVVWAPGVQLGFSF